MRRNFAVILAGAALLALPVPLAAQERETCAPGVSAPPPELAGWATRQRLNAATKASRLRSARLGLGLGVDAALVPTPDVRYPVRPEKPGGSVSYGGLFVFTVMQAGTYRVALGSGAWIDIVKGTRTVPSSAHGHGPDCTGIRKMVDFPLTPGRYTLQVAANGEAELPLLVTRLP